MNSDAKELKDRIDGLEAARKGLLKPCPHAGHGSHEARQLQIAETEAEIQELKQQLAEAQGKAVARAMGKGA